MNIRKMLRRLRVLLESEGWVRGLDMGILSECRQIIEYDIDQRT